MIDTLAATRPNLWLEPAIILLTALAVGLCLEFIVLPWLKKLSARTPWTGDDMIVASLGGIGMFWSLLIGITVIILRIEVLSSRGVLLLQRGVLALVTLSLVIIAVRISTRIVTSLDTGKGENTSASILKNTITAGIYLIGLLIGLQTLGVPITPALAALGVGGLAISLALQDTLANLFSGIWLVASNQVRPGHYVRLSDGKEGYVADINWRTTNIRELSNNMIVVPNTAMTSAVIVNYHVPEQELSVLIDVGVSYDCELDHVERVTIEVGKEVMQEVAGGVPASEPFIRYNAFQDSSINFTMILRGQTYVDQYMIKHEFVRRLHRRYKQEGIVIPYPIRTLHTPGIDHLAIAHLADGNGHATAEHTDGSARRATSEE